ncbi:hypothetical protein [Poseidonocella sp. HB161398]|uniref:hypothetical protein n=1 Tax=Poseidonocella sp. HB161398 TaxID=2320855 RepID=UPI0011087A53|nr:hypothetical protein [Poseidonocella sp. HB161398]
MDAALGDMRAEDVTSSREGGIPVLQELPVRISGDVQIGRHRGRGLRHSPAPSSDLARGGTGDIPMRKSGCLSQAAEKGNQGLVVEEFVPDLVR